MFVFGISLFVNLCLCDCVRGFFGFYEVYGESIGLFSLKFMFLLVGFGRRFVRFDGLVMFSYFGIRWFFSW